MDFLEGIRRWVTKTGQMLAFLAVLLLAFNPNPLHALAGGDDDHSHTGSLCQMLDSEESSPDQHDGMPSSHGDCVHHFDPMVQAPMEHKTPSASVEPLPPHLEPVPQQTLGFDPPPPRIRS